MKVLIDTNIEINAITHKTVLVSKTIRWGRRDQKLQVAQRDHFPPREDETFRQIQLPWLASLCNLAKQGRLEFFTSPEIQMETLRQKGYDPGYLGLNLLRDVPVKSIPCPMQRSILISATGGIGVAKREQTRFFRSIQHPRFLQIRTATGDAHIGDAFHLWTAEEAGLDAFLTMDQRFWRVLHQKNRIIDSTVLVMTPKELGERLNARPTDIEKLAAEISPFS